MTICYTVENNLYLNITNQCTNACDFCIRNNGDGAYGSHSLWLEREPTVREMEDAITAADPLQYGELVFCGYGEPTCRLDDMLEVCRFIREQYPEMKIRLNTNGQASLIAGKDVSARFAGCFDTVSISLNAPNAAEYDKICHSCYGEAAYAALLDFASRVKAYVPHVVLSVVDASLTPEEIESCRRIAEKAGVPLRVRAYIGKEDNT